VVSDQSAVASGRVILGCFGAQNCVNFTKFDRGFLEIMLMTKELSTLCTENGAGNHCLDDRWVWRVGKWRRYGSDCGPYFDHGVSMRRSGVIIGKVREENIGNGIREMAEFWRAGGLDSGGGGAGWPLQSAARR